MLYDYLSSHCAHSVLASSRRQGGELPVAGPIFRATFSGLEKHCPLSMAFDKIIQIMLLLLLLMLRLLSKHKVKEIQSIKLIIKRIVCNPLLFGCLFLNPFDVLKTKRKEWVGSVVVCLSDL